MDKPVFYIIVLILFFYHSGCEKQTTPIETTNISLTAEYVGVTEVELLLSTDLEELPDQYQLFRNGEAVLSGELTDSHTTLWDTTLQPARSYTYQVKLLQQNVTRLLSNELTLTTMDTTSHDFQWEIFEIPSPYGGGGLYDIAVINENDIWAVGEIYADSAQPWLPYNAVHWNGQQWELIRVTYDGSPWPIRSIYAFSSSDLWFDAFVRWNGTNFAEEPIPGILMGHSINKIWGTSSDNLFVVGSKGLIAHFNGSNWQKLESGTDLPIQDIWGVEIGETGTSEILCVAEHYGVPGGSKLLSIENDEIVQLTTDGLLSQSLWGIWFVPGELYVAVGDGYWKTHSVTNTWLRDHSFPALFKTSVHGNDINDIFICGAFWLLAHYNGMNWRTYFPQNSGSFTAVKMKGNYVVACGGIGSNVFIAIGER